MRQLFGNDENDLGTTPPSFDTPLPRSASISSTDATPLARSASISSTSSLSTLPNSQEPTTAESTTLTTPPATSFRTPELPVSTLPLPTPNADSITTPEADAETTVSSSQSSTDIVLAGLPRQDVPEAEEVGGDNKNELVVEHDEFAVQLIRHAPCHYRLRRTKPTMWRHKATCLSTMRMFDAIDDGVRVAASGIEWQIDQFNIVVLVVACLGYYRYNAASRSGKVNDTRVTQIIARDAKLHSGIKLLEKQFKRVSAVKLFRDGRPTKYVDVKEADKVKKMVKDFLGKVEDLEKGDLWLDIKPLFPPVGGRRQATPMPTLTRSKKAQEQAERRRKKREEQKRIKMEKEKENQRKKEQVVRDNKLKQTIKTQMDNHRRNMDARRRRTTQKIVSDHVANLRVELQAKLSEQVDMMKENLEDYIVGQIKKLTSKATTTTNKRRRSKRIAKNKDVSPVVEKSVAVAPKSVAVAPKLMRVATNPVPPRHCLVTPYDPAMPHYTPTPPYGLHSYPPRDFGPRGLPVRRPRPVRREIFYSDEDVDDEIYYTHRHQREVERAVDVLTGRTTGRKRRRYVR